MLALLREEFRISKLTLHSDLRRRAASRRALPCPSSSAFEVDGGLGSVVLDGGDRFESTERVSSLHTDPMGHSVPLSVHDIHQTHCSTYPTSIQPHPLMGNPGYTHTAYAMEWIEVPASMMDCCMCRHCRLAAKVLAHSRLVSRVCGYRPYRLRVILAAIKCRALARLCRRRVSRLSGRQARCCRCAIGLAAKRPTCTLRSVWPMTRAHRRYVHIAEGHPTTHAAGAPGYTRVHSASTPAGKFART